MTIGIVAPRLPPSDKDASDKDAMHERSLVKSLLSQVETLMRENDATGAVEVNVSMGEFAGVERDLFQMAFDEMVAGSAARGARLQIQSVPLEGRCEECKNTSEIADFKFQCAHCGSQKLTILRGEELVLESVVMEQASQ